MIKSIQFQEGGYITPRREEVKYTSAGKKKIKKFKEDKPGRLDDMNDNGIIRNVHLVEGKDYELVDVGYSHPQLVDNLLNRKIEFLPEKINVIFGPNASGKSTILKALAAYCQCGNSDNLDGWTNRFFVTPHNAQYQHNWFDEGDEDYDLVIDKSISHIMQNNAVVEWDGVPVYADNFSTRKSHGSLGDMCGSIFSGERGGFEELQWTMTKNQMSLGQNSMFILNKIIPMMKNPVSLQTIIATDKPNYNDKWINMFDANVRRLNKIYNDSSEHSSCNTFMFDEMDKSMDIENVAFLYGQMLPDLVKQFKVQIIIVSHSPLILTKNIVDNPLYNIISMDEAYTQKCKEMLSQFSF